MCHSWRNISWPYLFSSIHVTLDDTLDGTFADLPQKLHSIPNVASSVKKLYLKGIDGPYTESSYDYVFPVVDRDFFRNVPPLFPRLEELHILGVILALPSPSELKADTYEPLRLRRITISVARFNVADTFALSLLTSARSIEVASNLYHLDPCDNWAPHNSLIISHPSWVHAEPRVYAREESLKDIDQIYPILQASLQQDTLRSVALPDADVEHIVALFGTAGPISRILTLE